VNAKTRRVVMGDDDASRRPRLVNDFRRGDEKAATEVTVAVMRRRVWRLIGDVLL